MRSVIGAGALALAAAPAVAERVQVTGEVIDTWCYFSGVMGPPEAVTGTAHHTCALWCAAGGIPVGILAEDGTVYMVLKWEGEEPIGSKAILEAQSHQIVADGELHVRDGVNYIIVEEVVEDMGITNVTHDEWGVTPPFAIPEPQQ